MAHRTPRTIAEEKGTRAGELQPLTEVQYCGECGVPHSSDMPHPGAPRDYNANPKATPAGPPEARNLRRP